MFDDFRVGDDPNRVVSCHLSDSFKNLTYAMTTQSDFEITAKKHWATYIVPGILVFLGLLLLTGSTVWKVVGLLLIVFNAIKIISLNTVKWILNPSELYITGGILPWSKTKIHIPIFDIYESSVSFGLFGHLFSYGNISLKKTDGLASGGTGSYLTGAKQLSGQINRLVQDYKRNKNNVTISQTPTSKSLGEELKLLSDLKNNGELTQVEYDTMKSRLINGG